MYLYSFPVVAVTNYPLIALEARSLKSASLAKIKVSAGPHSF